VIDGYDRLYGIVKDPSGAMVPGSRHCANEETGSSQVAQRWRKAVIISMIFRRATPLYRECNRLSKVNLTILPGDRKDNEIDATLNLGTANEAEKSGQVQRQLTTESASVASVVEKQGSEARQVRRRLFRIQDQTEVTIGKNQSALVPILQAHNRSRKVTLWNLQSGHC